MTTEVYFMVINRIASHACDRDYPKYPKYLISPLPWDIIIKKESGHKYTNHGITKESLLMGI